MEVATDFVMRGSQLKQRRIRESRDRSDGRNDVSGGAWRSQEATTYTVEIATELVVNGDQRKSDISGRNSDISGGTSDKSGGDESGGVWRSMKATMERWKHVQR